MSQAAIINQPSKSMNAEHIKEEIRFRLMKIISEAEHRMTQRELARRVGISLGKTNYWVTEMVKEGLVQFDRFKNANSKSACTYLLTPKGAEEKFRLLIHFLSRKMREYEVLRREIEDLNGEIKEYNRENLEVGGYL